jgi:hypothetical protein
LFGIFGSVIVFVVSAIHVEYAAPYRLNIYHEILASDPFRKKLIVLLLVKRLPVNGLVGVMMGLALSITKLTVEVFPISLVTTKL